MAGNAFELAARFLSQPLVLPPDQAATAQGLLGALGYLEAETAQPDPAVVGNRQRILSAAANFANLFRLRAPHAPGLFFFGVQVRREWGDSVEATSASFSGVGVTPAQALESCVGEGIEYCSEWQEPGGTYHQGTLADCISHWQDARLAEHLHDFEAQSGLHAGDRWVPVRRLDDDRQGYLPAVLFIRHADRGAWVTSCGCAAGVTYEAALASALLEAVERDAAAAWWRTRRGGRLIGLEALAGAGALDLLGRARQGRAGRCTQFVDISDEFAPVIAAISFDTDGSGLAVGLACRLDAGEALRSALLEMCQMELALDLTAMKRREAGTENLGVVDRFRAEQSERFAASDTDVVAQLASDLLHHKNEEKGLNFLSLVDEMLKQQYRIYAADLTTPMFDIPVAKVFVPGLQPFPSPFLSRRLRSLIDLVGPSGRADLM